MVPCLWAFDHTVPSAWNALSSLMGFLSYFKTQLEPYFVQTSRFLLGRVIAPFTVFIVIYVSNWAPVIITLFLFLDHEIRSFMSVETVHPSRDFLHIPFPVAAPFQGVPSQRAASFGLRVSSWSNLGTGTEKRNSISFGFEAINLSYWQPCLLTWGHKKWKSLGEKSME